MRGFDISFWNVNKNVFLLGGGQEKKIGFSRVGKKKIRRRIVPFLYLSEIMQLFIKFYCRLLRQSNQWSNQYNHNSGSYLHPLETNFNLLYDIKVRTKCVPMGN